MKLRKTTIWHTQGSIQKNGKFQKIKGGGESKYHCNNRAQCEKILKKKNWLVKSTGNPGVLTSKKIDLLNIWGTIIILEKPNNKNKIIFIQTSQGDIDETKSSYNDLARFIRSSSVIFKYFSASIQKRKFSSLNCAWRNSWNTFWPTGK